MVQHVRSVEKRTTETNNIIPWYDTKIIFIFWQNLQNTQESETKDPVMNNNEEDVEYFQELIKSVQSSLTPSNVQIDIEKN